MFPERKGEGGKEEEGTLQIFLSLFAASRLPPQSFRDGLPSACEKGRGADRPRDRGEKEGEGGWESLPAERGEGGSRVYDT